MSDFSGWPLRQKVVAFDNSCTKAVLSPWPGPTPKRCELQLFLAGIEFDKPYGVRKLSTSDAKIWSFSRIAQKLKNITALLLFLPENLEKYRSTELYDAPLEG